MEKEEFRNANYLNYTQWNGEVPSRENDRPFGKSSGEEISFLVLTV